MRHNELLILKKFWQYETLTSDEDCPNFAPGWLLERLEEKGYIYCINVVEDVYGATEKAWRVLDRN